MRLIGITVIAGENDTGKSTVGRALFAMFHSTYHVEQKIKAVRAQSITYLIFMMYQNLSHRNIAPSLFEETALYIVEYREQYKIDTAALKSFIVKTILEVDNNFEKYVNDVSIDEFISQIKFSLNISDADIFKAVIEKMLNAEFNDQINNIFSDNMGEIILSIKEQKIAAVIDGNTIKKIDGKMDLHTEAVYIDDPFVLDQTRFYSAAEENYLAHREHLNHKLYGENQGN